MQEYDPSTLQTGQWPRGSDAIRPAMRPAIRSNASVTRGT